MEILSHGSLKSNLLRPKALLNRKMLHEISYLHQVLQELSFTISLPIKVFEDNTSAIKISSNPIKKSKIKHVNIHHHFVRDYVDIGLIQVCHLASEFQVADLFTKNLNGPMFQNLAKDLKLRMLD
jgi:hypothetical protein